MSHLREDAEVKFSDEAGVELTKNDVQDEVLDAKEEGIEKAAEEIAETAEKLDEVLTPPGDKPVIDASKLPGADYDGPVTAISPELLELAEAGKDSVIFEQAARIRHLEDQYADAQRTIVNLQTKIKVLEAPKAKPVAAEITKKLNEHRTQIRQLRSKDDVHNRTCGLCLKRKPIDHFRRKKDSELCEECEG